MRGDFGRIVLEAGANLQDNCVVHSLPDFDTVMEADAHIGHGCRIGRDALVGMNAVVMANSCLDALRMAGFKRHPRKQARLIFHSDQGSQYASKDLRDMLTEYGITALMSRRGNCWDNACCETLFGSFKVERLHGQRFNTRCKPWTKSCPGYSGATEFDCTRRSTM